mgnify:CR=1 FL=1
MKKFIDKALALVALCAAVIFGMPAVSQTKASADTPKGGDYYCTPDDIYLYGSKTQNYENMTWTHHPEEYYTNASDIISGVTLHIDPDGSYTITVPAIESFTSSNGLDHRGTLDGFTLTGKFVRSPDDSRTSGDPYMGELFYVGENDDGSSYYQNYYALLDNTMKCDPVSIGYHIPNSYGDIYDYTFTPEAAFVMTAKRTEKANDKDTGAIVQIYLKGDITPLDENTTDFREFDDYEFKLSYTAESDPEQKKEDNSDKKSYSLNPDTVMKIAGYDFGYIDRGSYFDSAAEIITPTSISIGDDGTYSIAIAPTKQPTSKELSGEIGVLDGFTLTGKLAGDYNGDKYSGGLTFTNKNGNTEGYRDDNAAFTPDSDTFKYTEEGTGTTYIVSINDAYISTWDTLESEPQECVYVSISGTMKLMGGNDAEFPFNFSATYLVDNVPGDDSSENVVIDTSAAESEGEDGGVVIDDEIVDPEDKDDRSPDGKKGSKSSGSKAAGAVGGGALVGAAVAGATVSGKKKKKEKGKSTYRMHVYKEFGDYIKKGTPSVYVFARIVETRSDGTQLNRPDLTARIKISSATQGLLVTDHGMSDIWKAGEVYIPDESMKQDEGIISFLFVGAGGTFTQNMHFRLLASKPYIEFPRQDRLDAMMTVPVLFGDGSTTEVPFILKGFTKPPERIDLKSSSDMLNVSYSPVNAAAQLYKATIVNYTGAVEPSGNYPQQNYVHITAQNAAEFAEGDMLINLYPYGIFVTFPSYNIPEDGYYNFYTAVGESVDYNSPKLAATQFNAGAAYRKPDGSVVINYDGIKINEKLTAQDSISANVEKRFKYRIMAKGSGEWLFSPGWTIPHFDTDKFLYKLGISFSQEGQSFSYELPIRLLGEVMSTADAQAREEEKQKLRRILSIVGLSSNGTARELIRNWDNIPTNQLHLVRRAVYEEGRDYYVAEAEQWLKVSDEMDKRIAFWATVRWLDNMAFSIVVRIYFESVGDYAEAIATPLYDMLLDTLGQRASNKLWERENEPISWQQVTGMLMRMAEGAAWACLTEDFAAGNVKRATSHIGALIAAAVSINFVKRYYLDSSTEGDLWKSIKLAVSDTGINAIKAMFIYAIVGKFYHNSANLKPLAERYLGKYFAESYEALLSTAEKYVGMKAVREVTNATAASRLAEGVAYALGDGVAEAFHQLMGSDPETFSKLGTTFTYTDENGKRHETNLLYAVCYLVKDMCRTFMLDEKFGEGKIKTAVNRKMPENQPYVSQEDVDAELGRLHRT